MFTCIAYSKIFIVIKNIVENENEKKDESVVNVGEVKEKVNNKKVEGRKIIGGKKMVKKGGRYIATWTCGVCK